MACAKGLWAHVERIDFGPQVLAMKTRYFALVMGLVFLAVGILGFVPGLLTTDPAMPPMLVDGSYGLLLGLFPVNVLHNVFHVLFGLWGVMAYRSYTAARWFAGSTAVIYGVLTLMGFFPGLNTLWGLVPLYGHDIWLHGAIAIVAAIFASMRETRPAHTDYGLRR